MPNSNDKYILQSVANSLDILDILAKHKNLSVPEIADLSGLGKSSVFRILATLESRNFVEKSADARYSLDIKLAYLGQAAVDQNYIIQHAHPHLELLTNASNETSHLAVSYRSIYVRFIDEVVSPSTIHMDLHPGNVFRASHLMACGKILLAYGSDAALENYIQNASFDAMTKHSIPSGEDLLKELASVRKYGYALDREESEYGLTCIAAPIFHFNGDVIAAVSISGPTSRITERLREKISFVMGTGKNISKEFCR